jgi:hypothetical protein
MCAPTAHLMWPMCAAKADLMSRIEPLPFTYVCPVLQCRTSHPLNAEDHDRDKLSHSEWSSFRTLSVPHCTSLHTMGESTMRGHVQLQTDDTKHEADHRETKVTCEEMSPVCQTENGGAKHEANHREISVRAEPARE